MKRLTDRIALVHLPLSVSSYKGGTTIHLGPTAQDIHAAFGLGEDDRHINGVDTDGMALAAIQGLNQKLEETRAENATLKARLERLEQSIRKLSTRNNGCAQ